MLRPLENLMIEICPKDYHIYCKYDEAMLYCFQLNINNKKGWRLLTLDEWRASIFTEAWYLNYTNDDNFPVTRLCIPVRLL